MSKSRNIAVINYEMEKGLTYTTIYVFSKYRSLGISTEEATSPVSVKNLTILSCDFAN